MFEDFINAITNFKANRTRTLLSLLGILIGVMSVVIATSLGSTLYVSIAQEFKDFSMDVVMVSPRWNRNTNLPYLNIDEDYRQEVLAQIPEIKTIFFVREFSAQVYRNELSIGGKTVSAVEPNRLKTLGVALDYGKDFSISDFANGTQVVLIGANVAKELFPEGNAVGKKLTLQILPQGPNSQPYNFSFEVIGVLKAKDNWFLRTSDSVYVNDQFYKNNLSKAGNPFEVRSVEVVAHRQEDASLIKSRIQTISSEIVSNRTNGTIKKEEVIHAFSAEEQFQQFTKMMNMISLILSAIAAISLLVGGIGIMNIMLVTVTERKKEIGIRKALGATNSAIRNQFLIEATTLTLLGGVLGVATGVFLSYIAVSKAFPSYFIFSLTTNGIIISFVVSVSIGIFFGLYPAVKAAKLDPVIALQE
jgi:ABC-type antimicrobial peptide transport system, permease component